MRLSFIVVLLLITAFIARAGDSLFVYGMVSCKETTDKVDRGTVYITEYRLGCYTDGAGAYKLLIPDSLRCKTLVIRFKYPGYHELKRRVRVKKLSVKVNAVLQPIMVEIRTDI